MTWIDRPRATPPRQLKIPAAAKGTTTVSGMTEVTSPFMRGARLVDR
jgi:hypothetical protein